MNYAVVMAGGQGKRLWPLSRQKRPKQVLKLLAGQTLLRRCFERLRPLFDAKNIIILTNACYAGLVGEDLAELPAENIIAEPVVRDTAGAIGLAAGILIKSDPEAQMAVVTADHLIEPAESFRQALKDALKYISKNPDVLITFGVEPALPSVQLGYIKYGTACKCDGCVNEIYDVEAFKEKPDEKTAKKYLETGRYLWNSGMFVWKAGTILSNIEKFLPEAAEPLAKIRAAWDTPNRQQALQDYYVRLPKISIDFAVMEKAINIRVIKLEGRWLDMGSFTALAGVITYDENKNTVIAGASELLDCKKNIIITEDRQHLIAAIGLKNMVVVHSQDATLICRTDQVHRLKDMVDLIREHQGEKFL